MLWCDKNRYYAMKIDRLYAIIVNAWTNERMNNEPGNVCTFARVSQ